MIRVRPGDLLPFKLMEEEEEEAVVPVIRINLPFSFFFFQRDPPLFRVLRTKIKIQFEQLSHFVTEFESAFGKKKKKTKGQRVPNS